MNRNNVKGVIGAFIGAILFSLPWILIYVYANYMLSVLATIIAIGSLKFYKLFKGEITKKTSIVIVIASFFSITFATFVLIPFCLILKEGYGFSTYYFNLLYSSSEFVSALVSDYIISILFTILGISGVVFNINKSAYQIENGCEFEYIEDKPFDEQVKILEAIFAKYDAFSRDKSVPETIIFSELKARNKFKFILSMERKGIIVSPFFKAYFDKEAVENKEKGKKNYRKNVLVVVCICVLFWIAVLLLVALSVNSVNNKDLNNNNNNIEEKIENIKYTYKEITIDMPNTYKIVEENDEYVDYYDPNNNDVIEFMMRVDSFSGETKKEAIDLYIEDLKKDYNVFSSDEILYDSLSGVRLGTSSLMYSDEYFYEYLLFDDEKVYTVMFFNRINKENENEFKEKFKNITDNYMKSIKIKKYDIY